jgi:hypothetical protein
MKKYLQLILLILASFNFLTAQNVSVDDYQVPVSRAQILRLNGFWNWAQSGSKVIDNKATSDLIFRKFYSSLPVAWFVDVDISGGWDINSAKFGDSTNYNYDVKLSGSARKYIWEEENYFAFAKMNLQYTEAFARISSGLILGAGYGRYIDATALAKVVRIEEHLLKEGAITGNLPKNTMIKIANIIERKDEYENIYSNTYETMWFYDIEKEIQASGMMSGNNLGAIGILRMRQVLFGINERVNNRYYGWDITLGARFDLSTPNDNIKVGSPKLNLAARYSYPLGWRAQVNSTAEIYTPLDSLFFKQINADVGIDFIYELSNRINFVSSYRLGFMKPGDASSVSNQIFNMAFLFYIENNIYVGINAGWQKYSNSERSLASSFSIQYNLF